MEEVVKEIEFLGHGKAALLEIMGSDASIVEAARVSYGKGTKKVSDDRGLLRYLVRHRHTSPLEMAEVKFYLKIPIFVARQLVRHRTANLNEASGRYSELLDEFYLPEIDQCGPQSAINNQGRAELVNEIAALHGRQNIEHSQEHAYDVYDSLLHVTNMSKEISRIVLPVSIFTEMYWKCDLHNFFHFLKLRLDPHAQYEIRVMAQAMYDLMKTHFPIATEAFEDYILYAKVLSRMEIELLGRLLGDYNTKLEFESLALPSLTHDSMSAREITEFKSWIDSLIGKS